ncbi:MAG: sulfatase-like hydrolase/transferase [Phycisphaerae bacterium]|jgi:hypothetical protein
MIKKTAVIHPFLLAVYPVLFLYSHNPGEVAFRETFAPIAIILGLTLPVWGILGFALKNWKKSGIIVSLFLVLFFSYGNFRIPLEGKGPVLLMTSTWIAIFILGSLYTARSRKDFTKATAILNIIAGILIALPVLNIISHQFNNLKRTGRDNNSMSTQTNSPSTIKKQSYPDIYFIILDAYARQDILKEIYNFDNSEFLDFLRKKGFYIADRSASNYCQTGLSVGSCFNLSYLDEFVKQIGRDNKSRKPLEMIIKKSFVLAYLKKHGYKTVAFASGRFETELQNADAYLEPGTSANMFYNALKNMTPLPDIMVAKKTYNEFDKYRQNILYMLDNLGKVAGAFQSPKFVFAHIETPHPPFVFGPNGEEKNIEARLNDHDGNWLIRPGRLSLEEYRGYYRDQIIFLNGRMEKVVDEILKNSKQPPIIMILGDHGPRSGTVWEDPEKTDASECMSILNAYYLPNNGDKLLYPEITPVNSFRVIFNYYFGEQKELLPDKSYLSTAIYLYQFHDVTDRL